MSRTSRSFLAFCAVAIAACSGSDTTSPNNPPGGGDPPAVASVVMTPTTATVVMGNTTQLTAVARDANNNILTNRAITWSSSAAAVATVSAQGLVTGVSEGPVTITATSEGKSASAAITVSAPAPAAVNSILLTPNTATLTVGNTAQFTAVTRDANNNVLTGRTVTWTSSAPNIATVNAQGLATGVSAGAAFIIATSEGKTAQVPVTIQAPVVPIATLSIAAKPDTIEAWDVLNLQAIARDANNAVLTGRSVTWTVSNPAVASISENTGVLTGLDRGTVTVTATAEGKTATVSQVVVIKYRSLTTGTAHACNIASGGIVWCWGLNGDQGRIGSQQTGAEAFSAQPVKLPGDHRFTQISTYGRTTCGIRTDNTAFCWGSNNWGALGQPSNIANSFTPREVSTTIKFRQVSAGSDQICGIATDSKAYCWGNNQWGQFGNGNSSSNHIPQAVGNGNAFGSITAGDSYTCAVTIGFAGFCWGADGAGQHGNGLPISNGNTFNLNPRPMVGPTFLSLYASNSMTCGLTAPGSAYCWGSSTGGRLGSQGSATSTPREVAGGHSFRNLSVGALHVCGVNMAYEVYCWGMNGNGQLGQTLVNGSVTPVRAGGSLLASEVSAAQISTGSAAYTCAESKDRLTTYCWGRNDFGQLGNGTTSTAVAVNSTPTIVVGQKPL